MSGARPEPDDRRCAWIVIGALAAVVGLYFVEQDVITPGVVTDGELLLMCVVSPIAALVMTLSIWLSSGLPGNESITDDDDSA